MTKSHVFISAPDGGGQFASDVEVSSFDGNSKILGPDGNPLKYETRQAVGFDLKPAINKGSEQ